MLCNPSLDGHRGNRVRGAAYGLASATAAVQLAAANTALRGEARAVATATHMCNSGKCGINGVLLHMFNTWQHMLSM